MRNEDYIQSQNFYIGVTEKPDNEEGTTIVLDNVISYKETDCSLDITLTVPLKNAPEYIISWLSDNIPRIFTIIRFTGDNQDDYVLTTDHKFVKVKGYEISGVTDKEGFTTFTVKMATAPTMRVSGNVFKKEEDAE